MGLVPKMGAFGKGRHVEAGKPGVVQGKAIARREENIPLRTGEHALGSSGAHFRVHTIGLTVLDGFAGSVEQFVLSEMLKVRLRSLKGQGRLFQWVSYRTAMTPAQPCISSRPTMFSTESRSRRGGVRDVINGYVV